MGVSQIVSEEETGTGIEKMGDICQFWRSSSGDQTQPKTKTGEGSYNQQGAGSAPSLKGELALDSTSGRGE